MRRVRLRGRRGLRFFLRRRLRMLQAGGVEGGAGALHVAGWTGRSFLRYRRRGGGMEELTSFARRDAFFNFARTGDVIDTSDHPNHALAWAYQL